MAGHSKWAQTKHKKALVDSRRGKLFTKLIRAIEVAARDGGGNVEANPTLADAIQRARDASMPNETIERAVKRGTGELAGSSYETLHYEGYGPGGVAVIVECLTDNRNRAANDVRAAFNKNGGSLAEPGAVNYLFSRAGVVIVPADAEEDDILMAGLDAGIEDVTLDGDTYTVTTQPQDVQAVREALEAADITVDSSEVTLLPSVTVPVEDESIAKQVLRLMEVLEDCDDVQNIYANFDIPDQVLEAVA